MNKGGYFLAALLLALAVGIGLAVSFGWARNTDIAVLQALALRKGEDADWMITAAQWTTWMLDSERRTMLGLAFAAWLLWDRRYKAALIMAVLPVLGGALSSILKEAFARPRPQIAPHLDHVTNLSFPSGHAAAGALFVLAALLIPGNQPRLRLCAALAAMVAVGLSRPLLGVHWPTDILAGWLVGLAVAVCGLALARNWEGRR